MNEKVGEAVLIKNYSDIMELSLFSDWKIDKTS